MLVTGQPKGDGKISGIAKNRSAAVTQLKER
jgi:hypothetical protein